jgi:inward rectifier potassium channel
MAINKEDIRDLGFGSVVSQESRQRLLNRDGSFNVERTGLNFWVSMSPYHSLLTMPWWKFHSLVALSYLFANTLFATAYYLCGPDALQETGVPTHTNHFVRAFFFSVQTIATVGFGHVSPAGLAANTVVTIESLVGLLAFALATGLLFARFSRPTAKILFSRSAIIAPYQGQTAFEFRIANARKNQIVELEAKVLFSKFEDNQGRKIRRFFVLTLERDKVSFFPLSWTIVHPIDPSSPLYRMTKDDLQAADAEFLILLTGVDETFSQLVHARSSYKTEEIAWNMRFSNIFNPSSTRRHISIDVNRIDSIELAETLPSS